MLQRCMHAYQQWCRTASQEALLSAGDAGISQTVLLTVPRHMDPPLYLLYTVGALQQHEKQRCLWGLYNKAALCILCSVHSTDGDMRQHRRHSDAWP
jgi:hypothetical protein